MPLNKEFVRSYLEQIRDERMTHANTATRVGDAMIKLLDFLTDDNNMFIRKDKEDSTAFLLRLLAGAVIGEANNIRLNPDGSIRCESIFVDGSAVFNELVINHQNVLEGDTYFTDRGIIETVEHTGINEYKLTMRKMYDNDQVTFHAYDVLRCAIKNLDTARTYRTSWMRVNSVDLSDNSVMVSLYDGEDVPGGVNFEPTEAARVIRWGNPVDQDRQNVFFVSSNDGRFLFLQGVTQPIINDTNYSAFIGLPPDLDIFDGLPLNSRHPYVYARGLIVQDLLRVDYQGNPLYTTRDRGVWDVSTQYIHGYDNSAQGYFTDLVWWGGCLWQAAVANPTVGREPRYNNADWVCLLGGANMSMEIVSSAGDGFRAGTNWQTTLTAEIYNAEMRILEDEIGLANIRWTRESNDTDGDTAWNLTHPAGSAGLSIDIKADSDVSGEWTSASTVGFRCTVTIGTLGTYSTTYSITI